MALEHRDGSVVKERRRDRPAFDTFGIALYRPSAETGDFLQCTLERSGCDPFAAM